MTKKSARRSQKSDMTAREFRVTVKALTGGSVRGIVPKLSIGERSAYGYAHGRNIPWRVARDLRALAKKARLPPFKARKSA